MVRFNTGWVKVAAKILTLRSQQSEDNTVATCQYVAVAENRSTSRALARRLNARPTADSTTLAVKSGCGTPYLAYQCCCEREVQRDILSEGTLHTVRAGMSRRLVIGAIKAASNGAIFAQYCRLEYFTSESSMSILRVSEMWGHTVEKETQT